MVSNPRQLMVTADNILSKTNAIGMRISYTYIGPELDPRHSQFFHSTVVCRIAKGTECLAPAKFERGFSERSLSSLRGLFTWF